ncbi:APC family permease [Aerococcaceae bacterium zg-ZJ1578]|uniref:APC family permease n=1 Tax=Aerococcaceae bacterium zg-252 TaxID=2796928 RepID=UPI001A2BDF30|nr:APC family permease [Aerococcaceae bacterium zg-1578]
MESKNGKKLSLWNLVGVGLGGAIGTGIFVLLGFGIAYTGRSIFAAVIVGCFFMLLAYWYQLAMTSLFVLDGGEYSMKTLLLSPIMTGVSAWMLVITNFAFASYAIAITNFLAVLWPQVNNYSAIVSFFIITLFFLTTIRGSRFITLLGNFITIVLIFTLALFIIYGVPQVNFANFFSHSFDGGFLRNGFGGFVSAVAVMGWACQGTTMGPISLAPVTINPKKTIPQSIIIITILLAIIYGGMAYVAAGVLPYDKIQGQNISVTAEAIFPRSLFLLFVVGGGIGAVASSVLGGLSSIRYPLIHVADDGWLPQVFKKQTKSGYPYLTYIFIYLISILPIVSGMSIDSAVSLVMIPTMLINIYMNLMCIILPRKFPEQWDNRSIKIPLSIYKAGCILGALAASVVAYNLFVNLTGKDMLLASVIILAMLGLSYLRIKQGAIDLQKLEDNKLAIINQIK